MIIIKQKLDLAVRHIEPSHERRKITRTPKPERKGSAIKLDKPFLNS
jgi:hypothetical protein